MAQNEVNIRFRITSDGTLKMVTKDSKDAAKATDELVNSRNRYNKGEKGVAGATSNTTKGFSKMRDSITGSGGLVAAYATLAANVFALSAVFLTLRRSAEVDQLRKGLSELGSVSGLAMESLSRGLVEATGNALSLEEAMRATAQVTSSGLDPSTLTAFGKAAKNISITLGRDVSDSFDRLTRGVTKLEPELLDELGLFVRVDEATQKYATALGKSASDLTNFERRQAFANEALQQATDKFGAIGDAVDTNAYAKLAAAVSDLTKDFVSLINTALVPVIEILAKNPTALFATIGLFGGKVIASAVANFGNFDAAAEKSIEKAKKIGVKVGEMGQKLNTTSKGMKKLSKALQEGNADSKKFEGGFSSITKSIEYYDRALKAKTVTEEVYKERVTTNIILTQQYAKAQSALTLSTANSTAQTALLALQQGEYSLFIEKSKEALTQGIQAIKESTAAMGENSIVTVINSQAKAFGAKITDLYSAAKTRLTAAVNFATASLMKFGIISKTVSTIQKVAAAATLFLSGANVVLATTLTFAGGAALFLGSTLLIALPLLSLIGLAATMAGDAFQWFMSFFRSDEENKLIEDLEDTSKLFEELTDATDQANRFFEGQDSKLIGLTEAYESLGNILSQIVGEYRELDQNPAFNDVEKANFFNEALADNVKLQEAVAKAVGLEEGARIKNTAQVMRTGLSLQDSIKLIEQSVLRTQNLAIAMAQVGKATEEGKEAAAEFFNALVPRTGFDAIAAAFQGISTAIDEAEGQADSSVEEINQILKDKLSNEQFQLLGIDPTVDSQISSTLTKIQAVRAKISKANRSGGNAQQLAALLKEGAELKRHVDFLRQKKREQSKNLMESVRAGAEAFKNARNNARQGKLDLQNKKAALEIEKALSLRTQESLEKQQKARDAIQEQIIYNAGQELILYNQILEGLADTEENSERRSQIQAKILELTNAQALATNKILTSAEKLVEKEQLNLKNVQDRQKLEKAIIDSKQRSLNFVVKELALQKQIRDSVLEAKAALQNREVTSEETLVTNIPSRKSEAQQRKDAGDIVGSGMRAAMASGGYGTKFGQEIERVLRQSGGTLLGDQVAAEIQKERITKEKIRLEYDLLDAQYALLEAEAKLLHERGAISDKDFANISGNLAIARDNLGNQERTALNQATTQTTANLVDLGANALAERARVEEERRIQVRDAMIQQGERMMAQDRVMQGLQVKRNAFEAERQVLAKRVAELKKEQKEGEEPSQALMQAEAALQANLNTQLQIRAEQIAALIENAKNLSGGSVPGLESITAQTANEIVPEVPGAESGMPTAGVSATGEDPSLTMQERVGQLRQSAMEMTTVLGELGPEGEAMQQALNGAFTLADTFATAFDQINDGGMTMQEGLQAAGAVVAGLAAMQQAQGKQAVAAIDKQIAAEKKRDGKSKESLAKIAALEKKKEKIERKNFERNKRAQLAQAIISTAAGIAKAVSESPMTGGLPGSALAAAIGAAQIAVISGQTFQGGGGSSPSAPSKVSVGNRQNTVDLARANSPSGELAYARNQAGVGTGMTNFTPTGAFGGMKYRANGGNTAFMVGEQGPELFVPETSGTILPSDETESIAPVTNVNFSINAVDGASVEELLLTQRGNIIGMIREAANGSGESFLESVNILSDQYQGVE